MLALMLLQATSGEARAEPVLAADRLVPAGMQLSGPDWHVETPVAVRGFLGQFVLQTEWGAIEVQGRELLALRIAEIDALERLNELSRTEVFSSAIADSARSTTKAVERIITQPVETVKGIPSGLGRLITRTASSARKLAVTVGDAARRARNSADEEASDEEAAKTTIEPKDFANELAGVNRARRSLARELGIDPYSGNPLLQERLEELAWAAVAGGMSMDLLMGQVGGAAADVIETSRKVNRLVWDRAPDDIRRELEATLVDRGHDPMAAREFLRNSSFTPTLQLRFVEALQEIGQPAGEPQVLLLAEGISGEVHARFLIQQLRMLARHVPEQDPIVELIAFEASMGARTRSGEWWITLPVDYLHATGSGSLDTRDEDAGPARLVVAGGVSENLMRELERYGWTVVAEVGLVE